MVKFNNRSGVSNSKLLTTSAWSRKKCCCGQSAHTHDVICLILRSTIGRVSTGNHRTLLAAVVHAETVRPTSILHVQTRFGQSNRVVLEILRWYFVSAMLCWRMQCTNRMSFLAGFDLPEDQREFLRFAEEVDIDIRKVGNILVGMLLIDA